ncbi:MULTISPECIES: hypothetical protein [Citrobacter]|uniref:hypothetical protein n=1 Tax=Citrobacter TaxID=544 RepID=UPI00339C435D
MAENEFKKFANFTSLITPQLITVSYWLLNLIIVMVGTWFWTMSSMVGMVIALVLTRIGFELVMVSFKNNEYLRRICEAVEAKGRE